MGAGHFAVESAAVAPCEVAAGVHLDVVDADAAGSPVVEDEVAGLYERELLMDFAVFQLMTKEPCPLADCATVLPPMSMPQTSR